MGRMKPRIVSVALPPYGAACDASHDRSRGEVTVWFQNKAASARIPLHKTKDCAGRHCVLHRPSDHPLKDAPMILRLDRNALVERKCPHGVGHPDPDSVAYLQSTSIDEDGVHGCDGCCSTKAHSCDDRCS